MASIVLETERRLSVRNAEARTAVMRCLRAQDFKMTNEQVSMVSAKRGSQVYGAVAPKKLPIVAVAHFTATDDGCTVHLRLSDDWKTGADKVWGAHGPFRAVLEDIQSELDEALDPLAGPGDPGPHRRSDRPGEMSSLARANEVASRVGSTVGGRAEELLSAQRPATAAPRTLQEIVLRSSKGIASFDRMAVQGLFSVALLISSKPDSMPPNLARDVESFSTRLESAVLRQPRGRLLVEVSDDEIQVAEFLARQASLRGRLPLRTLHVCITCKLERVVNPDFAKLQESNQRKKALSGMVGASISTRGIRPFFLVGSLLKLKNFDTPFVCQRCQGLDADSSLVTFCPQCGDRRAEAVLRKCPHCEYVFARLLHNEGELWGPEPPPAIVAPPPQLLAPAPQPMAPPVRAAAPPFGAARPPTDGPTESRFAPAALPLASAPPSPSSPPATPPPGPSARPRFGPSAIAPPPPPASTPSSTRFSPAAVPPPPPSGVGRAAPAPGSTAQDEASALNRTDERKTPSGPPPPSVAPGGSAPSPTAGWYPDQSGRHQYRYWDGATWTGHVRD